MNKCFPISEMFTETSWHQGCWAKHIKNFKTFRPFYPVILLLEIYPEEINQNGEKQIEV